MVFLLLSVLKSVTRAQTYKVLYVCYSFGLGQTAKGSQGLDFIDFENCHVLRNVHLPIKSKGEKSLCEKAAFKVNFSGFLEHYIFFLGKEKNNFVFSIYVQNF